jgi:hypothetical protein
MENLDNFTFPVPTLNFKMSNHENKLVLSLLHREGFHSRTDSEHLWEIRATNDRNYALVNVQEKIAYVVPKNVYLDSPLSEFNLLKETQK